MAEAVKTSPAPSQGRRTLGIVTLFALGAVFGAALTLVVMLVFVRAHRFGPHGLDGGGAMISHLSRRLDLDPQQEAQLRVIIETSHGEVRKILDRTHRDIRAFLRPDQQVKFDRIRPPPPPPMDGPPPRPGP